MTTSNILLWVAQVILALSFIAGAIMKFMPVEKIAPKMPWMGQFPVLVVRLLGIVDLIAAAGIILPTLLLIHPQLTAVTAICVVVYMLIAIIFHVRRGEAKVIGFNIFVLVLAAFVAWGRF